MATVRAIPGRARKGLGGLGLGARIPVRPKSRLKQSVSTFLEEARSTFALGAAGALFGLLSAVFLCLALTIGLAQLIGAGWAALVVALLLASGAAFCFFLLSREQPQLARDADDVESAAAEALARLPGDAARSLAMKHPILALAGAGLAGYAVASDPRGVSRDVRTLLLALM